MSFIRKYIKARHFVLTLIIDKAGDKGLKEHVSLLTEELGELGELSPFVELADASKLTDFFGFSQTGVAVAGSDEINRKPYNKDRLAILVSRNEAHNLANSYRSTSLYFRYDVKIFRKFREALEWLGVADLENEINELRKH